MSCVGSYRFLSHHTQLNLTRRTATILQMLKDRAQEDYSLSFTKSKQMKLVSSSARRVFACVLRGNYSPLLTRGFG